ncbi:MULTISPECIES: type II toxin-antitoxin system Phd/YefM family antitoxin [unclassified Cyanobium]|jgi:prevent-host-death family protein|uniref:type II toxin-antitoxin system Phd/YefM family antitoxin n=1 Tax=unclassified Cyanobium TaxID=2627006 RepID=UPI0020CFC01C|nr:MULTISPECIES: type II toxin-antitoxin system prevent-host-death family antitoxin [unclassified Cyanobium]MCP9797561.1 type II toxin-antitoxin system Phd/YefM family antitoxin [Cyanobium sp. Lug-B]MCP9935032.1 type II toxin-antitoxin system Phd/YefM family antitoxin [Cyanobium sp. Candia 9D4]
MKTVGAFEAKTHLSSLLEEVAGGEEILITRHGNPLARLVPVNAHGRERRIEAIERLRSFATGRRLNGPSIQELRDEGRRC